MHLTAARMLASKVSSSHIARSKTGAILGESLDLVNLESELEDEELTVSLDGSEDLKKHLKRHLLAEAKSFRELEALTETLDNIETVISMTGLLQE
jgi:nuclear pore complex protein Nup107